MCVRVSEREIKRENMCMFACVGVRVCVCVCMCVSECVCVCVCV